MQNPLPISVDDRRFTIWNWLGFICATTFITVHFCGFLGGTLAVIWGNIWVGDFTQTDLIRAVVLTVIGVPALMVFYGLFYLGLAQDELFGRGSILLAPRAGHLILKWRHITGLTRQKTLALADIRDVNVTWSKSEDGKDVPQLELIPVGKPVCPTITKPADAADLPALAARLRAELAAVGWTDASACGCPQGEAASRSR